MKRTLLALLALGVTHGLQAQTAAEPVEIMPMVMVYSPRVANQDPVGTFAMPISALRFEPLVDVQARNLAEGQAEADREGIPEEHHEGRPPLASGFDQGRRAVARTGIATPSAVVRLSSIHAEGASVLRDHPSVMPHPRRSTSMRTTDGPSAFATARAKRPASLMPSM